MVVIRAGKKADMLAKGSIAVVADRQILIFADSYLRATRARIDWYCSICIIFNNVLP